MAKPQHRDIDITIKTTPTVMEALETLAGTGLHGTTPEDVAEELIRAGIRQIVVRDGANSTWLDPS
jgi:hypothetical protein